MKLRVVAKTVISILIFSCVMQPISAVAALGGSSLSKTYAAFGSQITLYGSNLELADYVVIRDSSSPPNRYTVATFTRISSEELLITIPALTDLPPSASSDTWYEISAGTNTYGDSNYLNLWLFSPQPYNGMDGRVSCSTGGFAIITSNSLSGKYECSGNLTIPEGVEDIVDSLFYYPANTGLTSLSLPNSLLTIGTQAFIQNSNLTSVTFGSKLTTIGSYAFYGTRVTSLNIPSSVTSIGTQAFSGINTLKSVDYCWPSGIHASDIVSDLLIVNLICSSRTTIDITSTAESGVGSLKNAIDQINASREEESFIVKIPAGTYNILNGLPEILRDVEIQGQGETTILNLLGFGADPSNNVLFRTSRTSVDLILNGLKIQGVMSGGTLVRNQNGHTLIKNSSFSGITNNGSGSLIDSYSGLDERTFSVTENLNVEFKEISGSSIFSSDYGFTPSTSLFDSDYNNRIYVRNSLFDNVTTIAQVERFLKIENSTFRNNLSTYIATGNNRFQLLNSTFENNVTLNLNTAWDPITGYSTRAGMQTSLLASEKVITGNTFKNRTNSSPFISVNTDYWNVGLLTFTDNDFEFNSNLSKKLPELSDALNNAATFTAEILFSGNRYFYPSTITFDGNGSTSGFMSANSGIKTANLPANQFTRIGYSFNGWDTQSDGAGTRFTNFGSYTYGIDQTLYATWYKDLVSENSNSPTGDSARIAEEQAKKAQELQQLLTVLPSIGTLALEIGNLIESLTIQKCVKGKKVKKVKVGAKCPAGYKVKK